MVVLKADAYGHGAVQVAHTALRNGATRLGVACVPEARVLRRAGIRAPVLVLGYTPGWQGREAVGLDLTLAVFDLDTARALGARRPGPRLDGVGPREGGHGHAPPRGGPGRGRRDSCRALAGVEGLEVTGVFTHFACADDPSPAGVATTDAQVGAFGEVLADLDGPRPPPDVAHASNSAGLLCRDDARFDLVRPGIAVYGLPPGPDITVAGLRPALAWKAQVAQVHDLAVGASVGYGHTWTASPPSRVATVPVGYADGLRRAPATWRQVLVRGSGPRSSAGCRWTS